jgi:uncharacterized protein YlaN (UPF0358 family)
MQSQDTTFKVGDTVCLRATLEEEFISQLKGLFIKNCFKILDIELYPYRDVIDFSIKLEILDEQFLGQHIVVNLTLLSGREALEDFLLKINPEIEWE